MVGLGKVLLVLTSASAMAGCATTEMPWGRHVDRELVGTITDFAPVVIVIGTDVFVSGGEWVIDPVDKPGKRVKFRGMLRQCPANPPGKTLYLIQLVRYDKPTDDVLWWMEACTPIDRETSDGL